MWIPTTTIYGQAPDSTLVPETPFFTASDTIATGEIHLRLYDAPGWRFSHDRPVEIGDRLNLHNTTPVNLRNFRELRESPEWSKHGWFEVALYIDSTLAGQSLLLNHRGHAPVRVWLNGVKILENGNATSNPNEEVLSRYINQRQAAMMFRDGMNYVLVEFSEHTLSRYFTFWRTFPDGIFLNILEYYEPYQRRHRAFLFGGAFMLLSLLALIHAYLGLKFKGNYHSFVALTTLSLLLLAFTTLSDTLINWTYSYLIFSEFAYAIAVVGVAYFFCDFIAKDF